MGLLIPTATLKHALLVGQSLVFLIAFASVYRQAPGLYGESGIIPVAGRLEKCKDAATCHAPALFLLTKTLEVKPSTAFQIIAFAGVLLSLLTIAFRALRNAVSYVLLTLAYLSLFQAGGTFLWFQWDTLLLESGWLMAVLASFWDSPADILSTFLIRFLVVRLMFASGVVKLQSLCPTWWGLTALDVHFESQCLPTPLASLAHFQPEWARHFGVAATFFIEIYLPPVFLLPFPLLRAIAGVFQIVLMVAIMLTGNYNFFNIHYAVLCLACFEAASYKRGLGPQRGTVSRILFSFIQIASSLVLFAFLVAHWAQSFGIRVDFQQQVIHSKIQFDEKAFNALVHQVTMFITHAAIGAFLIAFVEFAQATRALNAPDVEVTGKKDKKKGYNHHGKDKKKAKEAAKEEEPKKEEKKASKPKNFHFLPLLFVLIFGNFLFWISFIPFTQIDQATSDRISLGLRELHKKTEKLELTHSYGLFRRMTGVEGRPEIILEGSSGPGGPWTEIEFYAKPGNLSAVPPFVLPHQPRLDWQMWFAALGAYQHNPWFLSLVNRLLNEDKHVIGLLKSWPFDKEDNKINFLRAQLYHYRFAKPGSKTVWTRALQSEYMPPLTKDSPALVELLKSNNLIATRKYKNNDIDKIVIKLYREAAKLDQTQFVWAVLASALVIIVLKNLRR